MNRFFQENGLGIALVLALGIVFPFTYTSQLIDPVFAPRFGILAVVNCFISCILLVKKSIYIPQSKALWGIFIGLLLLTISSILLNEQPTEGINRCVQLLSSFFIFAGMLSMLKATLIKPQHLVMLVATLGCILIMQAGFQITLFYSTHHYLPVDNGLIKASMANKGLLSTALFACIPVFMMCHQWLPKLLRPLLYLIILYAIVILLITQSKSSLLALLVFTLLFISWKLFFYCRDAFKTSLLKSSIIASIFFITVISTIGMGLQDSLAVEIAGIDRSLRVIERKTSFGYEPPSTETRLILYYHTWKLIKENPFMGIGPGNWKLCFPCSGLYQFGGNIKEGTMVFQRAHSDVLQFIAEFGILAFVLLALLLSYFLYYLLKALLFKNSKDHRQLNILLFSFFIAYLAILLVDFSTERPTHLMILGIYAALALFINKNKFETISAKPPKKWIGWAGLALSAFTAVSAYHWVKGEYYSVKMNTSNFRQTITYEKIARSFAYHLDPFSIPLKWQSGVAYYTNGDYHKALTEFKQAYEDNPCQIHVINNLASTYVQLGNSAKAIEYYLKGLKISPTFEESLVNLAAVYFNEGRVKEAFTTISKCALNASHSNYQLFLQTILKAYADNIKPGNNLDVKNLHELFISSVNSGKSFEAILLAP